MLILVGVTVSIAINGGLFGTARDAVRQTQIAEIKEQVQTDIAVQRATNLGDITSKQLKAILDNYFTDVPETLPEDLSEVTLTAKEEYGGYKDIPLTDIYNGTLGEFSKGLTAADIAKKPTEYYGEEVAGYNTETEVNKWRIFYADDTNIYLISDNIIPAHEKCFSNSMMSSSYEGELEDSLARKWIENFLRVNSLPPYEGMVYMLNTDEWNEFVDVNFADYAIGGPTIELYCASYRDTHPDHYIEYKYVNDNWGGNDYYGCLLKWSPATNYVASISIPEYGTEQEYGYYLKDIDSDFFNYIYVIRSGVPYRSFALATPCVHNGGNLWCLGVNDFSRISDEMSYYDDDRGLRPIVCLKSSVKLEEQNGVLTIIN